MGARVSSVTTGLLTLSELRERAALALAPEGDDDPPVLNAPVDAISPPALVLAYEDPMLTFETPCYWTARLAVVCYVGRFEPDAGVAHLEELLAYVARRMRADAYIWPHETTRAPRMVEYGGIPLLTARHLFASPVTLGGTS